MTAVVITLIVDAIFVGIIIWNAARVIRGERK